MSKLQKIGGEDVTDATKALTININTKDVAKGDNKNPGGCAAAVACVRQVDGVKSARVHLSRTYLKIGDKWVRYMTPNSLRTEILAFDRGGEFEPGTHTLRPLAPSHRADKDRHKNKKRHRGGNGKSKRRAYHVVHGVRYHGANR